MNRELSVSQLSPRKDSHGTGDADSELPDLNPGSEATDDFRRWTDRLDEKVSIH
jgi:hypothetical protein